MLKKYGVTYKTLFTDETHSVVAAKFGLHIIGVFDMFGNFIPLLSMLTSRAEEQDIGLMFRAFFASVPVGSNFEPRVIMTDKAPAYSALFARAEYSHLIHRWCYWCVGVVCGVLQLRDF